MTGKPTRHKRFTSTVALNRESIFQMFYRLGEGRTTPLLHKYLVGLYGEDHVPTYHTLTGWRSGYNWDEEIAKLPPVDSKLALGGEEPIESVTESARTQLLRVAGMTTLAIEAFLRETPITDWTEAKTAQQIVMQCHDLAAKLKDSIDEHRAMEDMKTAEMREVGEGAQLSEEADSEYKAIKLAMQRNRERAQQPAPLN